MAGVDKVNGNIQPAIQSRVSTNFQQKRGKGVDFHSNLADDTTIVERGDIVSAKDKQSSEEWLRKRTLEELRTIVTAIQEGFTDPYELTDLIFFSRHPELKDVPLSQEQLDEWNSISALLVHPALNEVSDLLGIDVISGEAPSAEQIRMGFERASLAGIDVEYVSGPDHYNDVISRSVEWCPGLSPSILKSLLAQESNFNPTVINQYGYAGIAQFGRAAAREVGLNVGIAGSEMDERLNPYKAIPGAARLLNVKAQRLGEMAFSRYGQPNGVEFWKFVLAAYNGGEATVSVAMGHAYRVGMERARVQGLVGYEAVSFARNYASQWDNLKIGGMSSPLGLAAARYFPTIAESKYFEIGNYPTQIVMRASGQRI